MHLYMFFFFLLASWVIVCVCLNSFFPFLQQFVRGLSFHMVRSAPKTSRHIEGYLGRACLQSQFVSMVATTPRLAKTENDWISAVLLFLSRRPNARMHLFLCLLGVNSTRGNAQKPRRIFFQLHIEVVSLGRRFINRVVTSLTSCVHMSQENNVPYVFTSAVRQ